MVRREERYKREERTMREVRAFDASYLRGKGRLAV